MARQYTRRVELEEAIRTAAENGNVTGVPDGEEVARLRQRIRRLEEENAILKKATGMLRSQDVQALKVQAQTRRSVEALAVRHLRHGIQ